MSESCMKKKTTEAEYISLMELLVSELLVPQLKNAS